VTIPAAIELAIVAALRTASIGASVRVLPYRSPAAEGDTDMDRQAPCIDVRCSTPALEESMRTWTADVTVECRTALEDDRKREVLAELEAAAESALGGIYAAYINRTTGTERTAFESTLASLAPAVTVGGYTFESSGVPYDDSGYQAIGYTLRVHFARAGY